MSLTPERLEQIRAHARTDVAELLAEVDRLREDAGVIRESERVLHQELDRLRARLATQEKNKGRWRTRAQTAEDELAARPTRAEVLEEAADTLIAACPDHGERSDCRMTCACDVAAELRMDAAGHPVHEAPVLPWLPLLDDEDRDSLAVALEEEVCGGTDNVMRGLEHLLSRYRRFARPASTPDAAGGAR
ncbi:hypothetical protein ACWGIB_27630 [Streptomyces xiamenensis]